MPITAMLPPSGDRDIRCHTRVDQIYVRYMLRLKRYDQSEVTDNLKRDLMLNVCMEVLGSADTTPETVDYMLEVDAFWRKPTHVQTLEVQLGLARAELAKRTEFLAWLTVHLQSPKFQGEGNNFINTSDILHAMQQHGVYNG
jgi:hypothetical protein